MTHVKLSENVTQTVNYPHSSNDMKRDPIHALSFKKTGSHVQMEGNKLEAENSKFSTTTKSAFNKKDAPYLRVDKDLIPFMNSKFTNKFSKEI